MRRGAVVLGCLLACSCAAISGLGDYEFFDEGATDGGGDAMIAPDGGGGADGATDGPGDAPGDVRTDSPATPDAGLIKRITFENGLLVHPLTGADDVTGTPGIINVGALQGTYSMTVNGSDDEIRESFTAGEVYVTFLVKVNVAPQQSPRIFRLEFTTNNIELELDSTMRIAGTNGVTGTSPILTVGTTYRLGIHARGGILGTGEVFLAAAGSPFGSPFATSGNTFGMTTELRLGTLNQGTVNALFDDIWIASGNIF